MVEPGTTVSIAGTGVPAESAGRGGIAASARLADSAGVFGAIFAALCCAGTPLLLSVLAAVGLSFLRSDAILWPLMGLSLAVALWGFWAGRRLHGAIGPIALALMSAIALTAGVIFVHGPPAMMLIYFGAVGLLLATLWNILLRRHCVSRNTARPA